MSDIRYAQCLQIDGAGVVEGSLHNYHGTFTSTSKNSKAFSFSPETMRNIVKQAAEGVQLFKSHQTYYDPIGKFTSAYVYGEQGRGNFFIRENLEGPRSNDVIKMIDSEIMDSMSIGFAHTEKTKVMCDACSALGNNNSEMKPKFSWFSYTMECEEGHVLGRKFKLDGQERLVTATYKGEVRLREVSVVGAGADPNAKIKKKLMESLQSGELELSDLNYISECMNIELSNFNRMLGLDDPASIPEGDPMSTPNEGLQAVVDELNSTIEGMKTQIEELEGRPTQEQHAELNSQLEAKVAELGVKQGELDALKAKYEKLAEDGTEARALEKSRGFSYLKEYYGDNFRDLPECVTHIKNLEDENASVSTLRSLADGFRAMAMSKRPAGRQSKAEPTFVPKSSNESGQFQFDKNVNPGVVM